MTVKRVTVPITPEVAPKEGQLPGDGRVYETRGISDETVYVSTATMRRGTNVHSGKTWCRFETENMHSLSWRSGRMRYYRRRSVRPNGRHRSFIYDQTTELVKSALSGKKDYYFTAPLSLVEAALEKTGKPSFRELVASEYPLAVDIPAGPGVTPLLALPNVQEFTRAYFGKSRYRKDLVRGVAQRGWLTQGGTAHLELMRAFATFVPVDWIATHLNDLPAPSIYDLMGAEPLGYSLKAPAMRKLLRTVSPKQMRRLMKDAGERNAIIVDTLRTFERILEKDYSYRIENLHVLTWKELHTVLPKELQKLKHRNLPVEYKGKAKELIGSFYVRKDVPQGVIRDGDPAKIVVDLHTYEIIGTPDTWTLADWGREMNNCIGGYTNASVRGSSLLYAVLKDGQMIANMEIAPKGEIRQLVGKHNATLPREDHDAIVRAVKNVWPNADHDRYWGRMDNEPWHANMAAVIPQGAINDLYAPRMAELAPYPRVAF